MKTIRSLLAQVALKPESLQEVTNSVSKFMLDMDLDNTFLLAYTLEDVNEVAEDMGASLTQEEASAVLHELIDNYNPVSGLNLENFRQAVDKVLLLRSAS